VAERSAVPVLERGGQKDVKILWTFCIYNEIELLPFKIEYMRKNGIDFYVFDNMSTDGSWEWLQENGIPSERFDSKEMFDLEVNLKLLNKKIHEVKPNWAMMGGADIFYVHPVRTLREEIEFADRAGFNCIYDCHRLFQFLFTGEERPGRDPRLTYMYYRPESLDSACIARYSTMLKLEKADVFTVPERNRLKDNDFVMLHYSMRHDAEERKTDQYERRKKAWACGHVDTDYGAHYERIVLKNQFVKDKASLRDVRSSGLWERIRSL
jgi:hypothetical protein